MVKKIRDYGFKKIDIDGGKDDEGREITELREKCWNYINALTEIALNAVREALCVAGDATLRKYITNEWRPKEIKTMLFYTRKYRNLGALLSQMSESYHDVTRELTNGQLTLEESTKRLAKKI